MWVGEKMFEDRNDNLMTGVIYGRSRTQTKDAQWLCLEHIYQKFNRPNFYDIGGTYIEDVAHFWFQYKTEVFGHNFLLHIFIMNHEESTFKIGVSYNNNMTTEKNGIVYLPRELKQYTFSNVPEKKFTYITTYTFPLLDVEALKNKTMYIKVKFMDNDSYGMDSNIMSQTRASHDLGALLDDPVLSDFTIESADGHTFKVHKLVLATQSEVFKAMLKEDTAESQNNYVKLVDVKKDDLQSILQFIYTGTVKDIWNCNCVNLLMLADRYDLKDLYLLAQHALCEQLSLDTALEILVVGDMYNSSYLKHAALKFIKLHPSVMKSGSWKELKNPDLIREVCEFLV